MREAPAGWQRAGFWLGPVAAIALLLVPTDETLALRAAAVATLMAIWWITEAVPLAATALVPIVLFPLLGVLRATDTAAQYANPIVFLFLGGFILALAMQRWGLHRRIALGIVARVGTQPKQLVFGFMLATAFISMWISNTATAAMMIPIGIALCDLLRPKDADAAFPFGTALMLGIAYAATIGGVATLIGTPPNAVFAAAAAEQLGRPVGFAEWLAVGLPVAGLLLPITWLVLIRLFPPGDLGSGATDLIAHERASLGPIQRGEKITAIVFALMALAWIFREPKPFGTFTLPGLATLWPAIDDSTIAIGGALALFLLPANRETRVLTWDDTKNLPWGVLLLFGGGLALARAFETSGLSGLVGQSVQGLGAAPPVVIVLIAVALFIALSELASNTAVAAMAMPILAATAIGLGLEPVPFMAVGALASSCAFMMPVGTPPNAIAFATGHIRVADMARAGLILNIVSALIIVVVGLLLAPAVF
jgi:sodium-dependent dicarboxylate transporter 2/3/5